MADHSGFTDRPTRLYAVISSHGGAGTSTVARMLDPENSGIVLELPPGQHLPQHYTPVVVARSTAYGLRAATDLMARWHPQVPRPWLVVVRDAPLRLPLPVRYRVRVLSARTLGVAYVPYLYRLRVTDTPSEALPFRPVAKAARALRGQLGITD